MSEAKHTPGPWEALPNLQNLPTQWNGWGVGIKTDPRDKSYAPIAYVDAFPFAGQVEANARLIAAAPELLAACKQIVAFATEFDKLVEPLSDVGLFTKQVQEIAKAAITKAEGREAAQPARGG